MVEQGDTGSAKTLWEHSVEDNCVAWPSQTCFQHWMFPVTGKPTLRMTVEFSKITSPKRGRDIWLLQAQILKVEAMGKQA